MTVVNSPVDGRAFDLIAIDLDGTLLNPRGEVSPRTRSAVHRAIAAGFTVCFATGRNWTESLSVLESVDHFPVCVFVGGAMVVDTLAQSTLHRTVMHTSLASEICQFFENQGHAALALQDAGVTGIDYLISEHLPISDRTAFWMEISRAKVHRKPRLGEHDHQHTIRVGVVAEPAETKRLQEILQARFASRIVCHSVAVLAFGVEVLEVFDPTVSKWQGLQLVAQHYGINPAKIIAIGDDVNDIAMLQGASLGIAMGNAKPQVQASAKRVIGPNSDDGLAEFLEQLVQSRAGVTPPAASTIQSAERT